jgi:nitrogen-specific signal transduction histidine kinase
VNTPPAIELDESASSPHAPRTVPAGSRSGDAALTLVLLLVVGLLNLYLYASDGDVVAGGVIVPQFYYLVVLVSALVSRPMALGAVWMGTSASSVVFAVAHAGDATLALMAAAFPPVAGAMALAVRSLRKADTGREDSLRALDSANAQARKRLTELAALFEVSQHVGLTFDLEGLFHETMRCVSSRLRMYRGVLAMADPHTHEIRVRYAYGLTQEQIARSRYRLGEGIYGRVVMTGEPMAVPNIGDEPIVLHAAEGAAPLGVLPARPVAFLCVPVRMEGKTVGVLSVDRGPVDERTLEDDLHFLTILASIFAQALKIQDMVDAALEQERLAALGKMATRVAHEVRNPLGGVRGAAQLLQMSLPDRREPADAWVADAHDYAGVIIREVDRLNAVVEELLHFGNVRPARREAHDLPALLDHVLFLTAAPCQAANVRVTREYEANLASVEVDGDQMTQVFLNLVRNAIEAMPDGGELHVVARTASPPDGHGGGASVEVEIADTGEGIPPHLRQAVFSPIYTTKRRGTGIGLALTRRLVQQHGGTIAVREREPHGACFAVALPVAAGTRAAERGREHEP